MERACIEWGSAVSIAATLLGGRAWDRTPAGTRYQGRPDLVWGPPASRSVGVGASLPRAVERPGRVVDHAPLMSGVKTSIPPMCLHDVSGDSLALHYMLVSGK